jgi:hypothetical protein
VHINAAYDFDVRLLRNTFLAVTEPEFDQSLRYQFGFEMCATEPPHGVPCLTLAFNTFHPAAAIRFAPAKQAHRLSPAGRKKLSALMKKRWPNAERKPPRRPSNVRIKAASACLS